MEQNKQNSALLVMDIQPPTIQMLKEKADLTST